MLKIEFARHWYASPDWWLVAVTGGLWFFTALMWFSTRKTAKAVVDNERPWIGLYTISPTTKSLSQGKCFKGTWAVIQNFGRSPALKMRVAFQGCVLPKGDKPTPIDPSTQPQKPLFPGVQDFYPAFENYDFPAKEVSEIGPGIRVLWLVGRIIYFDGQGHRHETNIRTRWDPERGEFVPDEEGNDAT